MTQKDNCGECDLGFNPHQEHYRQVNLPSVLSSPNGEGNGINSITNLSPYRPIALTPLAKVAFTMAEILLSLTIIGVVAAITLPSLTGNINERTWNTQRKALYSRMSQATQLMPAIRGYGSINTTYSYYGNNNQYSTPKYSSDDGAEAFITSGLSKVYKLNNICDKDHLGDCGLPGTFKDLNGSNVTLNNLKKLTDYYSWASVAGCGNDYHTESNAAAFETANGESLLVHYNPLCKPLNNRNSYLNSMTNICVNFLYDLNGKKGPNTIGKDMGFMSLFYPVDAVLVAPVPLSKDSGSDVGINVAKQNCRNQGDARLPNKEELMAIAFNRIIMGSNFTDGAYWSGSVGQVSDNHGRTGPWRMYDSHGDIFPDDWDPTANARCIKQFQ